MLVLLLGLLISLSAYFLAFPRPETRRQSVFVPLALLHIGAAVGFWLYAQSQPSDANLYWNDIYGLRYEAFEPGTAFTVQLVHRIKDVLDGSFFAQFILFQSFGLVGLALILRSFQEIADLLKVQITKLVYGVLFLPGLHFWTAAIGKDAPVFFGIALSVWASLKIERRAHWFALAVGVMFLFRPHIAALACISVVATFLFNRRMSAVFKLILAPVALGALVFVAATAQRQLGLKDLDAASLTSFVERSQGLSDQFGGGADLADLPFYAKLLSLLFRPFFFDTGGLFGLIVSFENLLLVGFFAVIVRGFPQLVRLAPSVFFIAYSMIFAVVLVIMLALINYNVGLGLRQKMMAMPTFLVLFATLIMYRRYRYALSAAARADPGAGGSRAGHATP